MPVYRYRSLEQAAQGVFRDVLEDRGITASLINEAAGDDLLKLLSRVDEMLAEWQDFGLRSVTFREPDQPVRTLDTDIRPALFRLRRHITSRLVAIGLAEVRSSPNETPPDLVKFLLPLVESNLKANKEEREFAIEEARQRLQADLDDRKWTRWFAKDSATIAIGGILLVLMVITIVGGMATSTPVPDVLTNAFLLVLGYFFGQGAKSSES